VRKWNGGRGWQGNGFIDREVKKSGLRFNPAPRGIFKFNRSEQETKDPQKYAVATSALEAFAAGEKPHPDLSLDSRQRTLLAKRANAAVSHIAYL
jgi:hypothetical protein